MILVYGARGLVGQHLMALLGNRAIASNADITDQSAVTAEIQAVAPMLVFLAAAYTDVDGCERDPARSWNVNVVAVKYIAIQVPHVVFFSTDYVFDGKAGPYYRADLTNPISVYGRHKLAAEHFLLAQEPTSLIIRATQIFGTDPRRKNFVYQVVDALSAGKPFLVAVDQHGTPTYAPWLANFAFDAIMRGEVGILHAAHSSMLNRYEFAKLIAARFKLDASLLKPCFTRDLHQVAPRPLKGGVYGHLSSTNGLMRALEDMQL